MTRSAAVGLTLFTLCACSPGQAPQLGGNATASVSQCITAEERSQELGGMAVSGTKSEAFAAESKAAAEVCSKARRAIMKSDLESTCGSVISFMEAKNWALVTVFEGRGTIQDVAPNLPPEPTQEMRWACEDAVEPTQDGAAK